MSSELSEKRLAVVLGDVSDAMARFVIHALSAPVDVAGVGLQHPSMIRMAVALPAPLRPANPNIHSRRR
jgi:hypothetical protein